MALTELEIARLRGIVGAWAALTAKRMSTPLRRQPA
jgi:hypothetical protein